MTDQPHTNAKRELRSSPVLFITTLLVIVALLSNQWFIGYFFSPTGEVTTFALRVFIGAFQTCLLLIALLFYFKGSTRNGRKEVLFSIILLLFGAILIEGFSQVFGALVETQHQFTEDGDGSDSRLQISPYDDQEWAASLFDESRTAYSQAYRSFYLWSRQEFHGEHINVDASGMRKTWNPETDAAAKNLFVFGGSTVWGTGARDINTIPSCLSRMLYENGHHYTVFNFGESAYTITQEVVRLLILLKEGHRPDVVVFYDGVNDVAAAHRTGIPGVDMQYQEFRERLAIAPPPAPEYTLTQDLFLAVTHLFANHCATYQVLNKIPNLYRVIASSQSGSALQKNTDTDTDLTIFSEEAAALDNEALGRLADGIVTSYEQTATLIEHLSRAYGFTYYLFWQPVLFTEPHATDEETKAKRLSDRSMGFLFEEVYRQMKACKIPNFHDISDVLNERTETVYIDFCHLSEAGNAAVAQKMYNIISPPLHGENAMDPLPPVQPAGAVETMTAQKDLEKPFLHLTMDSNDAIIADASKHRRHQTLRDLSGKPDVRAHAVPGPLGVAVAFDGVDDFIEIPAEHVSRVFAAGTVTDFSVAFWWRSDSDPFQNGYREIVSNYTPQNGGFTLFQRGKADGSSNRIYMNFYLAGNHSPVLTPSTGATENIGVWHHYVFQREGETLRVWCDGVLEGSFTDPAVRGSVGGGNPLFLNSRMNGSSGALDDFRLYDYALTESEINGLFRLPGGVRNEEAASGE